MKLFAFAALVAAASAARLEHLEDSYLPPDNNVQNGNGFGSGTNRFGVSGHSSNGFGSNGASDGFGSHSHSGSLGSNRFDGLQGFNSNGLSRNEAFKGDTSNQYLPPNHDPSASSNFGVNQFRSRSESLKSNGLRSSGPQSLSSQPQFGAASRQYLAPKYTSPQQTPQQPFDVNSGYIY